MANVLVGTYRPECRSWIEKYHLYNLPFPPKGSLSDYSVFEFLVLYADGFDPLAFKLGPCTLCDNQYLSLNDYPVPNKPHAEQYVLFQLLSVENAEALVGARGCNLCVSSSRWTGRVDEAFYANPYPQVGGKSMTYIWDCLRPYVTRWQSAVAYDPKKGVDFNLFKNFFAEHAPFRHVENPTFTFIDLFAGIGGFRLAMQRNGGQCVFSSEWNEAAQKTYFVNYGEMPFGDITQQATKDAIPENFDILCAGFPCQPFSIAGVSKKKSLGRATGFEDKTQGTLFFDVCRILQMRRPRAFLLENVKNLCSHDKGNTFRVIRESLEELNYEVFYQIIDGQNYVPQHRERILIVGFDRERYGRGIQFDFNIHPVEPKPVMKDILDPYPNPRYTLSDKLWSYLQNYAAKHKAAGNGFGYGIAPMDGISRTLSARYYKDGSEILIEQRGKNPRRLTPRECARLMGYPEEFVIRVADTSAYKQFGNSVVMPLMADVGRLIVEKLDELNHRI